ncbi:MAG: M50 family metallopeptidase [Alphaproteobacteria bacterium]
MTQDLVLEDALRTALRLSLLPFIIFAALIIHEMGHFLAAQLFGVTVKTVEIGRGRAWRERMDSKGTRWVYRWIPYGAHVDLVGLDTKPYWQRALTILAGPIINLASPLFVLFAFFLIIGQPSGSPVILGIEKGGAAERAGLKPGDRLLEVNHIAVFNQKHIWREAYDKGAVEGLYKFQRGEEIFEVKITPPWTEYLDDGIKRKHPRFGIFWDHDRYKLKAIFAINGQNTKDKPDLIREILIRNFDTPALITIKGPGDENHVFEFVIGSKANAGLLDKAHRDYGRVYFGGAKGNVYLKQSASAQLYDAYRFYTKRIAGLATIPKQLLPIDPYVVNDEDMVNTPETDGLNVAYFFVLNFMTISIVIGFINLLPLPYLDGGYILTQGIETVRKKPLSLKEQALLFSTIFLSLYGLIFLLNMDKLPRYIDSRLKKVHEFTNQKQGNEGVE